MQIRKASDNCHDFPPKGYIVGAPKCGTTALAQYLSAHPQVAFSKPKEPHYFSADLPGLRRTDDADRYMGFYAPTDDTRILMEASVWYLYSRIAIPEILRARPDALFIVMLRDPVRMLASLHQQLVNAFDEDVTDFGRAWSLSDIREKGGCIPPKCRAPSTLIYKRTAAFGEMLERLWSVAPREQTLVLFQEDMAADAGATYRQVLDFLGLDDDGRLEFAKINEAKRLRIRSLGYIISRGGAVRELVSRPIKSVLGVSSLGITKRLKNANAVGTGKTKLDRGLTEEIKAHYAEDGAMLIDLLGGNPPPWGHGLMPDDLPVAGFGSAKER